jgi:nitronate monooxygenase
MLNLKIPIIQAPVGSCSNPVLAAAVSTAGGMGGIAGTWTAPEAMREVVREVRAHTHHLFFINFALAFPCEGLPAALEAGAPVITFSWGLPNERVALVRSFGARFGVQVSTAEGARRAVELGADFLIAQGIEAGGHVQATRPLTQILPAIVDAAGTVPVAAAGGLATGAAIARMMRLGGAGAMLGTRFLASTESSAHPRYQQLLVEATTDATAYTICFDRGWPSAPQRVLRNATLEMWEAAGCPQYGQRPGENDVLARRETGEVILRYEDSPPLRDMTGQLDEMCLYAGAGVGDIESVQPAGELVAQLWRECQIELTNNEHSSN